MASDDRRYFHGTWAGYGASIMARGFELGHEGRGNVLGRGVYIAPRLAAAALWTPSDFIIVCRLAPGTRILWVEPDFDRRVINRLRREFGRELLTLGPNFGRAIPQRKHLTQRELVQLVTYIVLRFRRRGWRRWRRPYKGVTAVLDNNWAQISRLHHYLKRQGYDALGDRSFSAWDSDEIVVFNPARVRPVSAHWLQRAGDDWNEKLTLSAPIPLADLSAISAAARAEEEA